MKISIELNRIELKFAVQVRKMKVGRRLGVKIVVITSTTPSSHVITTLRKVAWIPQRFIFTNFDYTIDFEKKKKKSPNTTTWPFFIPVPPPTNHKQKGWARARAAEIIIWLLLWLSQWRQWSPQTALNSPACADHHSHSLFHSTSTLTYASPLLVNLAVAVALSPWLAPTRYL